MTIFEFIDEGALPSGKLEDFESDKNEAISVRKIFNQIRGIINV